MSEVMGICTDIWAMITLVVLISGCAGSTMKHKNSVVVYTLPAVESRQRAMDLESQGDVEGALKATNSCISLTSQCLQEDYAPSPDCLAGKLANACPNGPSNCYSTSEGAGNPDAQSDCLDTVTCLAEEAACLGIRHALYEKTSDYSKAVSDERQEIALYKMQLSINGGHDVDIEIPLFLAYTKLGTDSFNNNQCNDALAAFQTAYNMNSSAGAGVMWAKTAWKCQGSAQALKIIADSMPIQAAHHYDYQVLYDLRAQIHYETGDCVAMRKDYSEACALWGHSGFTAPYYEQVYCHAGKKIKACREHAAELAKQASASASTAQGAQTDPVPAGPSSQADPAPAGK